MIVAECVRVTLILPFKVFILWDYVLKLDVLVLVHLNLTCDRLHLFYGSIKFRSNTCWEILRCRLQRLLSPLWQSCLSIERVWLGLVAHTAKRVLSWLGSHRLLLRYEVVLHWLRCSNLLSHTSLKLRWLFVSIRLCFWFQCLLIHFYFSNVLALSCQH